jgi:hypothetical protein
MDQLQRTWRDLQTPSFGSHMVQFWHLEQL